MSQKQQECMMAVSSKIGDDASAPRSVRERLWFLFRLLGRKPRRINKLITGRGTDPIQYERQA